MIFQTTGLPSQGKTLELSRTALKLLYRNKRWHKQTGTVRPIAHNFPINKKYIDLFGKEFFYRWYNEQTFEVLPTLHDCDLLWDENSNALDSGEWQNVPMETKVFLRHHAKRGVDIYATTQRWMSIAIQFRSLVDELYVAKKLIGSPRPSATKPPVKHPWGLIWLDEQKQEFFCEDKMVSAGILGWRFMFITKDLCDFYDTTYEIPIPDPAPLKHIERHCPIPNCGYHSVPKVMHV